MLAVLIANGATNEIRIPCRIYPNISDKPLVDALLGVYGVSQNAVNTVFKYTPLDIENGFPDEILSKLFVKYDYAGWGKPESFTLMRILTNVPIVSWGLNDSAPFDEALWNEMNGIT